MDILGSASRLTHANIEERGIPQAIEDLCPYLKHIHASGNDRGVLGEGHIDFSKIIAALKRTGYDGYLMIEGFGFSGGGREKEENSSHTNFDTGITNIKRPATCSPVTSIGGTEAAT